MNLTEDYVIPRFPNGPTHDDKNFHKERHSHLHLNPFQVLENIKVVKGLNLNPVPAADSKGAVKEQMSHGFFSVSNAKSWIFLVLSLSFNMSHTKTFILF